ncbi:MAG TPA: hypothetical protein VEW69_00290 [Alphaproteobacteria bacterium]|nr:hypothetical protein [Alphaproteobacteria bacterium]
MNNKEEDDMRVLRNLSSLLLVAAMVGPVVLGTTSLAAQNRDNDDKDHKIHRYYDRKHRDYHEWNERESRAYSNWEAENHRKHLEFERRHRNDQSRYWVWRHSHPDKD